MSVFEIYRLFIQREMLIYEKLNMLKRYAELCQGLVWVPREADLPAIIARKYLPGLSYELVSKTDNLVLKKPTKFYDNGFMEVFQMIVDTYGIPSYKEINPAVFTVISFPFLFGVMFGDIMHGTVLFVFSMWLLFANRKDPNSLAGQMAPVRYIFILMAAFALFCGFVYNDFTSMATQIFGEGCWSEKG